MSRSFALLVSWFVLALLVLGVGFSAWIVASSGQRNDDQDTVVYSHADSPFYETLGALTAASDLVVRGTVEQVLPTYRYTPPDLDLNQLSARQKASFEKGIGFLRTEVVVRVERILKGKPSLLNSTIIVTGFGGVWGRTTSYIRGLEIAEQGLTYVFFLHEYRPGRYGLVAGQEARYSIADGKLATASRNSSHGESYLLHGMPLEKFETDFQSLANFRMK